MKKILYILLMVVAVGCTKVDIYNTDHPNQGKITLTTDWSGMGAGVAKPTSYEINIGDYTSTLTSDVNTIDNLFEPGDYRAYLYSKSAHFTVNGTVVTQKILEATPYYLFTSAVDMKVERDANHAYTAVMRPQTRDLILIIEFTGNTADRVKQIDCTFSGLATTLDMATGIHGRPIEAADVIFTKITSGADAGKWKGGGPLLGVAGSEQKLTGTVFFSDGTPENISFEGDLTDALSSFNSDKSVPLTIRATTIETPDRWTLQVTSSTTEAWEGEDKEVTSKYVVGTFTASDLKIGDYYYSDGTWSDGGVRKLYNDGTSDREDVAPVSSKTVIGIVLKVGCDADGEWKDDCVYKQKDGTTPMSTIRGYVLALHDANGGNRCQWGSYGMSVYHSDMDREQYTGFYGYKNTNATKKFAKTESWVFKDAFPAAYYATEDYETKRPAPNNSSGWFLPSAGQCWYWNQNAGSLLPNIRKATGSDSYDWRSVYWSSSERFDNNAWGMGFDNGVGSGLKNEGYYVRAVLAF